MKRMSHNSFRDCSGKSKREVEVYLAEIKPKKLVSSGIKRKSQSKLDPNQNLSLEFEVIPSEKKSEVEPAQKEVFNFRFSADEEFKKKIERVAEVLGIDNPEGNLDEVIEKALEIALEKKDPQRKLERRKKRQEKKKNREDSQSKNKVKEGKENLNCCNSKERNRYIPDETREIVLERANYQCEYHSESGIRCNQRTHLEIDHIILFAFGGSNDAENLRVLCKSHNLFEAQKHFPQFYEKHF